MRKALTDNKEKKGGIALVNVNNRIHLLFGEQYGMHVYSIQGKGTDVEVTLPVVTSAADSVRSASRTQQQKLLR